MRRGDHNNITEPEEGSDKFYHSATKRFYFCYADL